MKAIKLPRALKITSICLGILFIGYLIQMVMTWITDFLNYVIWG